MDLTQHLLLVLLGLACSASGQFKHSKRRQQAVFKPRFSFPPPKISPVHSPPPSPASSVEVQKAEVHSEEFVPNQELQSPFATNVHFQSFGAGQDFREETTPRERAASFRHFGSTTPRPKEHATPIPIIRLEKQQSLDGSYKSNYETGNSIHAEETGFLKNAGKGEDLETLVQFGSYSYTDPDGQLVQVSYTADEGGFRATGSHLPTPPPVPPEVQRGLDIIFESIRREAEREAKKKKLKRVIEPENYPMGFHEDVRTENQARAPTLQEKQTRPQARH